MPKLSFQNDEHEWVAVLLQRGTNTNNFTLAVDFHAEIVDRGPQPSKGRLHFPITEHAAGGSLDLAAIINANVLFTIKLRNGKRHSSLRCRPRITPAARQAPALKSTMTTFAMFGMTIGVATAEARNKDQRHP